MNICGVCGGDHGPTDPCTIDETEILTVVIREEGGYWNVRDIDSNVLLTQCLSRTGAQIWAEANYCDVREE